MSVPAGSRRGGWDGAVPALSAAVAVALIALFCSMLAFQTADAESYRRADLDREAAELVLVDARVHAERAASGAVTDRLLSATGAPIVRVGGFDAADSGAALSAASAHGGSVAADAELIVVAVDAVDGLAGADFDELLEIVDVARGGGRATTGFAVVDDLRASSAEMLDPLHALNGELASRLLEPGQDRPALDPELLLSLDRIASSVPVGAPAAAMSTTDLVVAGDREVAARTAEWRSLAEAAADRVTDLSTSSDLRHLRFRIAGWSLAALAGVLLLGGVALVSYATRRDRRPTQSHGLDLVTGLPVARQFPRLVATASADARFRAHLVGIVRVTQFEMIVAGYGRRAADEVETVLARRLRVATNWLAADQPTATAVLVKYGPGAFAFSIHSAREIDVDLVREVITMQSGNALRIGMDHLPVKYAAGLHVEHDRLDIDLAIDAADRAVAEHVPTRRRRRELRGAPVDLVR